MLKADLAIGAGGTTSLERCCLGLPTLLCVLSVNQRVIAENLENLGAVITVRNLQDNLRTILNDFKLWQDMSDNWQQWVYENLGYIELPNKGEFNWEAQDIVDNVNAVNGWFVTLAALGPI